MKLADIKTGQDYAAHDAPQSGYQRDTPVRRVHVLEVVSETKTTGYRFNQRTKEVKRIKVEVMDDPTPLGHGYGAIRRAKKGDILIIETRQVVAVWTDAIADEVALRVETESEREALLADLKQRLSALLPSETPPGTYYGPFGVKVGKYKEGSGASRAFSIELTVRDTHALRLLELAEKGAQQS